MSLPSHFPLFCSRLSSLIASSKPVIGCSISCTSQTQKLCVLQKAWHAQSQSFHTSAEDRAARKGTRARREAIKKANKKKKIEEEVKQGWMPFHERQKEGATPVGLPNYRWKKDPPADDVYISAFFKWPVNTVAEAVAKLRSTHQPTMYNCLDAPVLLNVHASLTTDKAKRFLDDVSGILVMPHPFPSGQSRTVAVLTDCAETRVKVQEMGVQLTGGKEVAKLVLAGEVDLMSYDYIVSSLDILPELVPIRGLLRKKFPNPSYGTAVSDVVGAAHRFLTGLSYSCARAPNVRTHGQITVPFGTLSMEDEHLAANAAALLRDIDAHRTGHKSSELIDWAYVRCHTTNELLVLDHHAYLEKKKSKEEVAAEKKKEEPAEDAFQVSN